MSITTAQIIRTRHNNNFFDLTIDQGNKATNIVMKMLAPVINTKDIPQTYFMLKKYLPKILKSKCFNQDNRPFDIEVRSTEIGHLFEHILLEYLCEEKTSQGIDRPIYNGVTEWDWNRDRKGVFHINIDVGQRERSVFEQALIKSIDLTRQLIISHK